MSILHSIRNTVHRRILDNPCVITKWVYNTKDNGFGSQIPDLDYPAVSSLPVLPDEDYPVGTKVLLSTDNFYYIVTDVEGVHNWLVWQPIEVTYPPILIARRRLPEELTTGKVTPYDFLDVYYAIAEHTTDWLHEGLVFEYHGKKFKTRKPEKRIVKGAIAYWMADLELVDTQDIGNEYSDVIPVGDIP